MDAILMGVDREHLESAVQGGLGRGDRLVSFGTEVYPDPLSFPTSVPAFFYEVRAEAAPFATYRGRFVRYEADPGTHEFRVRLDLTRPETTLRQRDPSLPDEQQETLWGGYLFFTDLEKLDTPIPLHEFRIGKRPFAGVVVRRPLVVDWPG
jgi:hypothetical protein